MSAEQLKIVFEHETLNAESVLKAISTILEKHGIPLTEFSFEGRTIDLLSALPLLQKSKRKSFHLVGQDFEFLYGSVGNCRLDFLQIRSAAPLLYWDDWVTGFADSPHFVMAWVVDREYDFWQNADDPLEYTAVGKPYHHLPMKSNDLPYPVEQKIIDTSNNPGRWRFHNGYIEAIGATMWLGPPFWALTHTDQRQIERLPWLNVLPFSSRAIKIQVADQSFATAQGSGGELQSQLRSVLFPAKTNTSN